MIVVSIQLLSAQTGKKTELTRMHISNTGDGTNTKANYLGKIFRGRSKESLDKLTVIKTAEIKNWPKQRNHVWKLVTEMLSVMGYK